MRFFLLLAVSGLLCGCASVRSVSLTSIPANKGSAVRASASKVIFLGFNFDNDFVDQVSADLRHQCPNGMIKGILTKDEIIDYFLMIVHKRQVTATGYCVKASGTKTAMLTGEQ